MSSEDDEHHGIIRRTRSHRDTTSSSSVGDRQRQCFPEKLIDMSRRVHELGTAFVDSGAAISAALAAIVSSKALYLEISLKIRRTDEASSPAMGQIGLIRGKCLTGTPPQPPPQRRQATEGEDGRPIASILRSSRFSVTPTTCLHNVVSGNDEIGDMIDFVSSKILAPTGDSMYVNDFDRVGYELDAADYVVIRERDDGAGQD